MLLTSAFWALILPAGTAIAVVRLTARHREPVEAFVGWTILYAALVVVPVHLFAMLEILGVTTRFSLSQPAQLQAAAFLLATWLAWHRGELGTLAPSLRAVLQGARRFHHGPRFLLVSVALLGGCYVIFTVSRFVFYPESWDGVAYHLPTAVRWLQSESLAISTATSWREGLPGNAEIFAMLALGTGWQQSAELWNLLSAAALIGGGYLIARRLVQSAAPAQAAMIIAASVPIIVNQTYASYVDLFGSAYLVAGLGMFSLVVSGARVPGIAGRSVSRVALAGMAAGLAVGTKPTFWPLCALFLLGAVIWLLVARPRHARRSLLVVVIAACALIPTIFWFARGVAGTGNPFFPFSVSAFGVSIFDGIPAWSITASDYDLAFVRSRWGWLVYPWTENYVGGYAYGAGVGVGAAFATFVPLGMVYAMVRGVRRDRRPVLVGTCLYWVLAVVVWWFFLKRTPRFGLPLIALGAVLSAPLIERLLMVRPRAAGLLLVASVLTTATIAALPPTVFLLSRFRDARLERHQIYGIPELVDQLPEGTVVLNYNHWRTYHNNFALAGKRLANRVVSDWEVPEQVTAEFLEERAIEYIFEKEPFMAPEDSAVVAQRGFSILDAREVRQSGQVDGTWRVWRGASRRE